jgi:conjugal transfer pilus assembly protein TraL
MTKIPKYIDDPAQIFFWEIDDVIVFTVFMGIGIIIDMLFIMIMIGVGIVYGIQKMKQVKADGFLMHALYWYGAIPLKRLPPSYNREFIE